MRRTFIILVLSCVALVAVWSGCRIDPVVQEKIDALPAEDPDGPSELHRAGQPCVLCHSSYEGAHPEMAIGGTVFQQHPETLLLAPAEGVFVTIFDSEGASQKACTNSSGNFFVRLEDWPGAKYPLTVQVGNRFMRSLIGRERSCAGCHQLATQTRLNDPNDNADRLTGASRFSAGAILVDLAAVPPEQACGPNPASSTSAGVGGGGGSGGANVGGAGGSGGGN
jgi:hypothetical protein